MTIEQLSTWLHEQTTAFAAAVDGLDPATRVPTCPDWQVRDLVGHMGQAFHWSAELIRSGGPAPIPDPVAADPGPPEEWATWLAEGAAELAGTVQRHPDAAVWTFLGPRPARFWLRRMLHDLVVHHFDAANVTGRPYPVSPELAAATITEGLELITTPAAATLIPALAGLRGDGQTLLLRPADGPEGWLITRDPGGAYCERRAADSADVVLAGPTRELMLVLTRRLDPADERVTVTGDQALLADWLAHTAY